MEFFTKDTYIKEVNMFKYEINESIYISLIELSFASSYEKLVKDYYLHLKEFLAWPYFCKNENDFEDFIRKSLDDYKDGKSMVCTIFFEDKIVGNISFNKIDKSLKKVSIGYWLNSLYEGKGIITNCCMALVDYAFEDLEMEKVEIAVAEYNYKSRAVCDRLGMKLEGIISNCENINGKIVNHAIYSLHNTKEQIC